MQKFKDGDIIVANELSNAEYGITNLDHQCKGIAKYTKKGYFNIDVTHLDGKPLRRTKSDDNTYSVEEIYFDLALSNKQTILKELGVM